MSADDYYRALDARFAIYCHACRNGRCEDCTRLGCTCCNTTTGDTDD